MPSRERKLAAAGLLLRDDLLVHSLVQVIRTKTADAWTIHNGFEADVILCNPDSSLAGVALRRAGASACISVVHDGQLPLPCTKVLHAPIKSHELIALLNEVPHLPSRDRADALQHAGSDSNSGIAESLYELMRSKSPDLHVVESDAGTLLITPASRSANVDAPFAEADIQSWLEAGQVRVRRVDGPLVQHAPESQSIDPLLWSLGLTRTYGQLLHAVPAEAKLKLKHWPDFGRLAHQALHFRLAALLARGGYTAQELAVASGYPIAEVSAFINACAMCDLLCIGDAAKFVAPFPAVAMSGGRRYSSILRTIRSALGLQA